MNGLPDFRKPDRYKASSYRSYNSKMPARYDTSIWMKVCQAALWDRTIIAELGRPVDGALRILDVGCATGRLLERLAEAGATHLCGADLAPRILGVASEKLSRIGAAVDLRVADAEDRLPWDDGLFDIVTLVGVLHHFFRPGDALAEIRRVLNPGGRLLVIDPSIFPALAPADQRDPSVGPARRRLPVLLACRDRQGMSGCCQARLSRRSRRSVAPSSAGHGS